MSVLTNRPSRAGMACALAVLAVGCGLATSPAAAATKMKVSTVQSFAAVATYIALDKGYFKDAGLDVQVALLDSAADAMSLLATNQVQVVEGGVSVGFFNALARDMPIIMTNDRVSTPIGHDLVVAQRYKGKINSVTDLKGKSIGSNSMASVTTYELGKVLANHGMTLKDVNVKTLGFPQMGAALQNGALDATLSIPPFVSALEDQGIGYKVASVDQEVKPTPMTIAADFINTDWAKKNPEAMKAFFVAYMRATRDYCVAYHGGPNRKEIEEIALKNGLGRSIQALDHDTWTGRNVDGHVEMKSVLDQQDWYIKLGMVKKAQPTDKLYTTEYIDYANKKLGPPPPVNPDSKLPGCR